MKIYLHDPAIYLGSPWTEFMDMHSGGGTREPYDFIYIQAEEQEAIRIFINKFGHSPFDINCDCCGENYVVNSHVSLHQLTGYHRRCKYTYFDEHGKEISWDTYRQNKKGTNSKKCVAKYIEVDVAPESKLYVTLEEYKNNPKNLFIYSRNVPQEYRI